MVDEMSCEKLDELDLLFGCKASDGGLEHGARRSLVHSDEALVVHECEEAHDELTIHAVGHTTVTRDGVAKVLDVECSLQT